MCESCKTKDELIAGLRQLANGLQDNMIGLVEAFEIAKPQLAPETWPLIDSLIAGAKRLVHV